MVAASIAALTDDRALIERILDHIDHKTTDMGEGVWREPVVLFRGRLGELHAYLVDQAVWIWVVHDMNPRGLARHLKGFVQAQSWFQDLTRIRIE